MRITAARVIVTCLLLASACVLAQMGETKCRVSVSFEFMVGDTVFPAGQYMIYSDAQAARLKIVNVVSNEVVVVHTRDMIRISENPTSKLVFSRDKNGRHVLHQFWSVGDDHGHDVVHAAVVEDIR